VSELESSILDSKRNEEFII